METPIFFGDDGDQMFGVLHTPDRKSPRSGLLLCHAFGEEKLWSHRVFVNLAREAANRGIAVFRFDFRGHGDSAGHSEDYSVDSYLRDIGDAADMFRRKFDDLDDVGLIGLRLGGTLAQLWASQNGLIKQLVLWEPILDGAKYMQELLRINLSTQLAVYGKVKKNREALVADMAKGTPANVDGYLLTSEFFEDCSKINLIDEPYQTTDARSLIVQIAPNLKQKDRPDLLKFCETHTGMEFLKVEEPPFWREIKPFTSRTKSLIRETLDWWECQIGD